MNAVTVPLADEEQGQERVSAPARPRGSLSRRLVAETATWIVIVDALLVAAFVIASPEHAFWSIASLRNILADVAEPLLIVGSMSLLLGSGEFDLSLGANIVVSSVVAGKVLIALTDDGWSLSAALPLVVAVALATGALVGICNAFIVTRLRVTSLIGTLAVAGIAMGLAELMTSGADLTGIPVSLQSNFGARSIDDVVPLPVAVSVVVFALQWFVVSKTRFGLRMLAIGSATDAASKAGLRVARHLTILFIAVGAIAGLAAVLDLTRFAGTNIVGHQGDALAALSAAVIGGTSLRGGQVRMAGALAGALLATVLQDGLVVVGLSAFYQPIAIGTVLIFAVALDQYRRQTRARKGN